MGCRRPGRRDGRSRRARWPARRPGACPAPAPPRRARVDRLDDQPPPLLADGHEGPGARLGTAPGQPLHRPPGKPGGNDAAGGGKDAHGSGSGQPARRERSRAAAEGTGPANGRTRHPSSSHPTTQHPGFPPRQCSTSTRHRTCPAPGTVVTRHRLSAVGTLTRPVPPLPDSDQSTSPGTPEPSAVSIRRREAARSRASTSATTPLRARQRSASSMAHSMSARRRSPEATSNRPGSIPYRTSPGR